MNHFIDVVHNDDLGEELEQRLYVGASIDGMPIRTWYIQETLKRNKADALRIVLEGASK